MFNRFLLGTLKVDPEVTVRLGRVPFDLFARHAVCDHGAAPRRVLVQNRTALDTGEKIVSLYMADPTDPKSDFIQITTEGGWGSTRASLRKRA